MRWLALLLVVFASPSGAQDFTGFAKVEADASRIVDTQAGLALTLQLSQIVPYRVFTLTEPERLVLDFREVDWMGLDVSAFDQSEAATQVHFGLLRPGWSRSSKSRVARFKNDVTPSLRCWRNQKQHRGAINMLAHHSSLVRYDKRQ